ncbi:MAG: hypothetical protein ACD_63C00091G0003 [uncultured bacterium]|nr:MAG: hypothetical protein ACD_63C00091G0003 [uncultured bacterium]
MDSHGFAIYVRIVFADMLMFWYISNNIFLKWEKRNEKEEVREDLLKISVL